MAAVQYLKRAKFCLGSLSRAQSEIFNADQGSQFTSRENAGFLEKARIIVSRDGWGRALDNVLLERLGRSVKYEDIYIKGYKRLSKLELGCHA